MQTDRSMRSLDMCRREVIAGNHGFCSPGPAPSIKWPGHAAQASDCGCRTLAIARYPGPWIVRTGGKACEAPVSCFGRGLTGIFLRASREKSAARAPSLFEFMFVDATK